MLGHGTVSSLSYHEVTGKFLHHMTLLFTDLDDMNLALLLDDPVFAGHLLQ